MANPSHQSGINEVHDIAAMEVYRKNPGVVSTDALRGSADPVLQSSALSLPEGYLVVDLRTQKTGSGFSQTDFFRFDKAVIDSI